jgi:hypothetical protein
MQKMFKMVPVLNQMPIVYVGYKSLDDYVKSTTRLVTCKNNMFQVSKDPIIHWDIRNDFNRINQDSSFCRVLDKNSAKMITISYRISCFLINYTVMVDDIKKMNNVFKL